VTATARKVTAREVADAAGVSRTAVSFAFNDPSRLSESTRVRILRVSTELGYSPDPVARMLSQRRTNALGLLLPQAIPDVLENPYYSLFLRGIGQVCHREGMTLMLVPPLRGSMLSAIPYAAVDGFIVSGLQLDRGEVAELRRRQVPFVLVDSDAADDVPSVEITDREAMREVVSHMLELGHRQLAILSFEAGPEHFEHGYSGPLRRRLQGAADALSRYDLQFRSRSVGLYEVPCTRAAGYQAVGDIFSTQPDVTAIVCLSDVLAIGALDALRDRGIDVPGQLSVTGYDDQPEASWTRPALTTVRQPIEAKGRVAGDFLIAAIQGEDQHPQQVLHTALIMRGSVGPPRQDAPSLTVVPASTGKE